VTLLGLAAGRVVTRAGARPGDVVVVTGALGATGTAVRDRRGGRPTALPRLPDSCRGGHRARARRERDDRRERRARAGPRARRARERRRDPARAAARIPVAAACRRRLGARATAFALTAGEDYELACTVPRRRLAALDRVATRLGCRLTRVGFVVRGRPTVDVVDRADERLALGTGGFDHLAARRRRR
jgi:thiamine-monophosphate kinase